MARSVRRSEPNASVITGLLPSPAIRHQLSGYPLAERHEVASRLRASHRSQSSGEGLEFRQFRPYLPGDDLRRVDWRLFGRTDRFFVREAEQESRLTICLLLDTTASMGMVSAEGRSRVSLASELAGALAWLAYQRHHDVCLMTVSDRTPVHLPPASGGRQWRRILQQLASLETGGDWPTHHRIRRSLQQLPARSKVFFFSDCLQHDEEQARALQALLSLAHSLTTTQILLPQDFDLGARGQVEVVDVERGERRLVEAHGFRATYREQFLALQRATERQQRALGAVHARVMADTPVSDALRAMLDPRLPAQARLLDAGGTQ